MRSWKISKDAFQISCEITVYIVVCTSLTQESISRSKKDAPLLLEPKRDQDEC